MTPLIFVHIGKSGGGSTRVRFAAGALNLTDDQKWYNSHATSGAYYPMVNQNGKEVLGL
jgi:hypothetical protein